MNKKKKVILNTPIGCSLLNPFRQRKDVVKIGRNEKCPCGSGKKYKKCCGVYDRD